jgi:hypothetical protein
MRPSRFCGYALVILVLTSLAFGLDLTGKWIGKTGDGHDVVITLKSDGPQVSGTLLAADGKTEYPLQDVKSDGENLAFAVDIQWQGSPLRILAKGKTTADQVQLHLETEDASWSSDATLSREAKVVGAK